MNTGTSIYIEKGVEILLLRNTRMVTLDRFRGSSVGRLYRKSIDKSLPLVHSLVGHAFFLNLSNQLCQTFYAR